MRLVRALRNVRDSAGWHSAGSVFATDADLGDGVEELGGKPKEKTVPVPVKEEEIPKAEPAKKAEEKPKTATRRKKTGA